MRHDILYTFDIFNNNSVNRSKEGVQAKIFQVM